MSFFSFRNWFSHFGFNKAYQFEQWSVKVDKGESGPNSFRIARYGNINSSDYRSDLKQLSKDYISIMDTDGDEQISYDEFEKYHEKELYDNEKNVSLEQLGQAKEVLKDIYARLNVDNENASMNKLDYREIMNYFHTMDTNNDNGLTSDGYVTRDEYISTSLMLADKTKVGQTFEKYLKYNFDTKFKDYK